MPTLPARHPYPSLYPAGLSRPVPGALARQSFASCGASGSLAGLSLTPELHFISAPNFREKGDPVSYVSRVLLHASHGNAHFFRVRFEGVSPFPFIGI